MGLPFSIVVQKLWKVAVIFTDGAPRRSQLRLSPLTAENSRNNPEMTGHVIIRDKK